MAYLSFLCIKHVLAAVKFNYFIFCGAAIILSAMFLGLEGKAIACKIQKYHFHEEHLTVDSVEFVSLNCSIVHGAPANTILWSNEKYWHPVHSVSVPGLWSSLQIRNVTQKDAGTYRCEVKKGTDKQVCEVVLCRPKISRTPGYFTTTPQLIAEGTTKYVFHCYASGWPKPSFTWLKNGTEIKDGDVDKSYVLIKRPGGLELNILSVTKEDHQGHYSCVARNIFGERRYGILLKVKKQVPLRPLAHAHVNKVSKYTGEPALLTCVGLFTTEVTTVISWDFNGSQLNLDTDERYKLDYVYFEEDLTPKVNFSLLIKKVTERDMGKYRCRVITPGWSASDMIFLSLVKPPDFSHRRRNGNISLIENLLVSAAVFLVLGTAIIVHRVRTKRKRDRKPHLETDDFQYDVFVSFSTLDYPWVRDSLTPMLERKQINYCIHSRDFVVGKAIIENMADSVYNSRKVLAVISQNYLASHFCREELEIALYRCTKMADSSLLLIRVDDVDKKNLPKTLRRRTFLDYSSAMERSEWEQRLLKHIQVDESDAKIDTRKSSDKCQLI